MRKVVSDSEVIIVGGGIAGLCCGLHLHASGVSFKILEAEDRAGGRIRTDQVDRFLLDHGFQVLQNGIPRSKKNFRLSIAKITSILFRSISILEREIP